LPYIPDKRLYRAVMSYEARVERGAPHNVALRQASLKYHISERILEDTLCRLASGRPVEDADCGRPPTIRRVFGDPCREARARKGEQSTPAQERPEPDWARIIRGYAQLGLVVVPAQGKVPVVRYKHLTAPPSDEQVRRWIKRGVEPDAYWLKCGRCSGVIVFDFDITPLRDFDSDNSDKISILQNLPIYSKLCQECEPIIAETRRGIHYYLRCYDEVKTRTLGEYYISEQEGRYVEVMDAEGARYRVEVHLRGEGAGVIVPPSPDKCWLCGNEAVLVRTQPPQGIIDALKRYDASQQVLPFKGYSSPSTLRRVRLPKGHSGLACIKGIITAILDGRDCYIYHERDLVLYTLYNLILRTRRNTIDYAQDYIRWLNNKFSVPLSQKELDKIFRKAYDYFGCDAVKRNVPWAIDFCFDCPITKRRRQAMQHKLPTKELWANLPPSAFKLYFTIDFFGRLSINRLSELTGLSRPSVIQGLKILRNSGLLPDTPPDKG